MQRERWKCMFSTPNGVSGDWDQHMGDTTGSLAFKLDLSTRRRHRWIPCRWSSCSRKGVLEERKVSLLCCNETNCLHVPQLCWQEPGIDPVDTPFPGWARSVPLKPMHALVWCISNALVHPSPEMGFSLLWGRTGVSEHCLCSSASIYELPSVGEHFKPLTKGPNTKCYSLQHSNSLHDSNVISSLYLWLKSLQRSSTLTFVWPYFMIQNVFYLTCSTQLLWWSFGKYLRKKGNVLPICSIKDSNVPHCPQDIGIPHCPPALSFLMEPSVKYAIWLMGDFLSHFWAQWGIPNPLCIKT